MVGFRFAASLLFAAIVVVTPAWGQSSPVRPQIPTVRPQPQIFTPNQVTDALWQERLRNRPARSFPSLPGTFLAPTLNAVTTARKLNVLRGLGLNVQASSLGTPLHLAPLRHTIDTTTYMTFAGETAPTLALPPATSMNGAVALAPFTFVGLNFRASSPFQYYLVECSVDGASLRELLIDYYVREGEAFPVQAWGSLRFAAVRSGRAAVLLEPRPDLQRRLTFVGNTTTNDSYYFGGCEITPVSP